MIHVPFSEPVGNPAWDTWRSKAEEATKTLKTKYAARAKIDINEDLYKEMRQVFLDAFNGKCAYCEAKIILDQHHGDVEHYRPKGRVTDAAGDLVMIPGPAGQPEPHRGYPWLAYDWRNLLPSCRACNQSGKTREGRTVGKWDKFPVEDFRATLPEELEREQPRLLHPVFDEPEQHLVLDPDFGIVGWTTERGRETVEIFNLNREGLPEERCEVYLKVQAFVQRAQDYIDADERDLARRYLLSLQKYREGAQAWSWAGRLALAALGTPRPPNG